MGTLFVFTLMVLVSTTLAASPLYRPATLPTMCGTSRDCDSGLCCRSGQDLVDPAGWSNRWGDTFGGLGGGNPRRGVCSSTRGKKGEVCSYGCHCDEGLLCYRPMSGVCCPPSTCMPRDYVIKQREYWRNCFKNPKCHLPSRK